MATKIEVAPLTGLRFVAAFCVLVEHTIFWCAPFNDSRLFSSVASFFSLYGMTLFFVLSGFVIHYNYASLFRDQPYSAAARDFLSARFARIYPLFICFWLFGAVGDFTVDWIHYAPREFLSYVAHSVTLTQSWVYKIVVDHRVLWNNGFGLAWSLSCEFFFYLAYAVFVFAILPIRRPLAGFVVLAVFSGAVIGVLTLAHLNMDRVMSFAHAHLNNYISVVEDHDNSFYRWLFYTSPYVRVWEFVLGCLTAQLFLLMQDRTTSKTEYAWGNVVLYVALCLLLSYGIVFTMHVDSTFIRLLAKFFALNFGCAVPIAAVIFCTARYRTPLAAFLSLPWIVWLGDISYSIYAVHTWTLRPLIRGPVALNYIYGTEAIVRVALGFAFTIIVASATYAIIEVPCRRYLRAKLMRPPRRANDEQGHVPAA